MVDSSSSQKSPGGAPDNPVATDTENVGQKDSRSSCVDTQAPPDRLALWILIGSFALLALQISNQSLWIDEAGTAFYGLLPNLRAWWHFLVHDPIPNSQMPLSLLGAWLTAHTLGGSEWQLRSINLLWGSGGLIAFFFAGRALGFRWLPALLVLQPYFWFYNNEARPYSLEIFCGTLLVLGVVLFCRDLAQGNCWAWAIAAGAVLLSYTTILAPFPLGALILFCGLFAYSQGWRLERRAWLPLALGGFLLLPIAGYYVWTMVRGTGNPVLWKGDWKSTSFVFYELTGLSGLGPSLAEIREAAQAKALSVVLRQHWLEFGLAGLAGILWALLITSAAWRFLRERRWHQFALFVAIPLLAGGTMTILALHMKKVLWARHWAPMFPFYVAAMALVLKEHVGNSASGAPSRRLIVSAWIILLLSSALSLRFSAKHQKDDYRGAAALTKEYLAQGKTVWWVACWECAWYYHVPVGPVASADRSLSPVCYIIQPDNSKPRDPAALPVILVSRPSLYDPAGSVRAYAAEHKMLCLKERYQTFLVFLPPDVKP